jgi:hypothetical protein
MSDLTIATLLAGALDAYAELEALGEDVEDEWTYVTDLEAAWRERLESVIAERGDEAATPAMEAAIARAADEIGRIRDPHRAIDWLSTYPQVVLLAIGERP